MIAAGLDFLGFPWFSVGSLDCIGFEPIKNIVLVS